MPATNSFDYAIIQIVPRVERGERINAGIIVYCRTRRYLAARVDLDPALLEVLCPGLDLQIVHRHLDTFPLVCAGGPAAGPLGQLGQPERFHWLVAPRSTIIQLSAVHCGVCDDPAEALDDLFRRLVEHSASTQTAESTLPAVLE